MMNAKVEQPLPPTPLHLLRFHTSPVTALALSDDNERIYSADSSGKAVVTSSRSLRSITTWNPHSDSVLGIEEWDEFILTHGRDNRLNIWKRLEEVPFTHRIGSSAGLADMQIPMLAYSMDVNALNFCRFALLKESSARSTHHHRGGGGGGGGGALLALPNLIDSTIVDIWSLPSQERIHAAIGQESNILPSPSEDQTGRNKSGIIMAIHLYRQHSINNASDFSSSSPQPGNIRILAAYENGSVVLREYTRTSKEKSVEGQGWDVIWKARLHNETIMAMRVSRANTFALTVSADHLVGYYDLTVDPPSSEGHGVRHCTKHPGNGSLAIRDDGRVCAVGGWDGKIRLYSTKSFKPLGTLKYHKSGIQCLEFARTIEGADKPNATEFLGGHGEAREDEDEDDLSVEEKLERSRWLLVGSKDCRISIWPLISFAK